ncbi:MAG: integrase arm-type DNA-binding domain-containing protein [Pseudomonadota bacterium]
MAEEADSTGRKIKRLDAEDIASLTTVGRHRDGGGLILNVSDKGTKSWSFIWSKDGRTREAGFGGFPAVSVDAARVKAAEWRALIEDGIDPLEQSRVVKATEEKLSANRRTFGEAAEAHLKAKQAEWSNPKHRAQWHSTLRTYAAPIWHLPVADIDTETIRAMLAPIWTKKPETASRTRGRIEAVFDHARARGWRTLPNPAAWKGNLAQLLAKPTKLRAGRRGHQRSLPYDELPAFLVKLRKLETVGALALEFLILTAVRTNECLGAKRTEIDYANAVWTIPKERTKTKISDHRVALSAAAIAVLRKVEMIQSSEYIFPGQIEGKPLSDMSLGMVMRRLTVDATPHGFRSTFKVWASEATKHADEVSEAALGHVIPNKVKRAYQRSDLLDKRRPLMRDWAAYCDNKAPARKKVAA